MPLSAFSGDVRFNQEQFTLFSYFQFTDIPFFYFDYKSQRHDFRYLQKRTAPELGPLLSIGISSLILDEDHSRLLQLNRARSMNAIENDDIHEAGTNLDSNFRTGAGVGDFQHVSDVRILLTLEEVM